VGHRGRIRLRRRLARSREALVVQGGAEHDRADDATVLPPRNGPAHEQLLLALAVDPHGAPRASRLQRFAESRVRLGKLLAAHQVRAVTADDDTFRVHQRHQRRGHAVELLVAAGRISEAIRLVERGLLAGLRGRHREGAADGFRGDVLLEPTLETERVQSELGRGGPQRALDLVLTLRGVRDDTLQRGREHDEREDRREHDDACVDDDDLEAHDEDPLLMRRPSQRLGASVRPEPNTPFPRSSSGQSLDEGRAFRRYTRGT
jgi:hypothetical protein